MQQNSRYLVFGGLCLGVVSGFYFLSLPCHLPFFISVIIIAAACLGMARLCRSLPLAEQILNRKEQSFAVALTTGIAVCGVFLARKYGDWDAVYIYNLAARFLEDPLRWSQLFKYHDQYSHTDYPLHIPATVAFVQRLMGGAYQEWIPFTIGLFYTMAIPALLFFETSSGNRILAALAALAIAGNTYYLNNGVIQCADVPLAFYLLLCFISMQRYRETLQAIWLFVSGMSMALCIWTKNEGLIYVLVLCVFQFRAITNRKNIRFFLAGVLPLTLVWLLFKIIYAPANDMVAGFDAASLKTRFADKERYKMIMAAWNRYIGEYFYVSRFAALACLCLCVWRRVLPHRDWLIFIVFGAAMTCVYLCTYHDLAWHLETSASRILLQWYPSFWFVAVTQLNRLMPEPPVISPQKVYK